MNSNAMSTMLGCLELPGTRHLQHKSGLVYYTKQVLQVLMWKEYQT